jgi:hypothetical protein
MWRNYFGYGPSNAVNVKAVTTKYRQMSLKKHPNKGGSAANFQQLKNMYNAAVANLSKAANATATAPAALAPAKKKYKIHRKRPAHVPLSADMTRRMMSYIGLMQQQRRRPGQQPPRPTTSRPRVDAYIDSLRFGRPAPPPRRPAAPVRPSPRMNTRNYNVMSRSAPAPLRFRRPGPMAPPRPTLSPRNYRY